MRTGDVYTGRGGLDKLHVHVIKLTFHSIVCRIYKKYVEAVEY